MLSIVCLPVFIILVYVSGSATNDDIETSSSGLMLKESARTFIKSTALATTITTPSVTTDLSTAGGGAGGPGGLGGPGRPAGAGGAGGAGGGADQPAATGFHGTPTGTSTAPTRSTTKSLATAVLDTATSRAPNHPDPGPPAPAHSGEYLNITSQAGTHAYLPCNVKQLVKKPVSWIRVRDGHILTVDQTTFIADQRFQSIYTQNPEERWSLQIKYVQTRDAGSYECQVSTEPKTSARVRLQIVEPKTELLGETNRHVKAGSRVVLRCVVTGALEPPLFINWYFDKKQIFLHNQSGWRTEMDREAAAGNHGDKQNTIASLIIPAVTKKDSGNYTCSPSNSESITVVLHVLNGEYSASAITSGSLDRQHHFLLPPMVLMILGLVEIFTKI